MPPETLLVLELASVAGVALVGWLGASFVGRITALLDDTAARLNDVATQVAQHDGRIAAMERDR